MRLHVGSLFQTLAVSAVALASVATASDPRDREVERISEGDLVISPGWKLYDNFKYEYHNCYPYKLLKPEGESDAGDGEEFIAGTAGS